MTTTVTETKTETPGVNTPPVVAAVVTAPQQVTVIPPRTLDASDQRKSWALFFLAGGGLAMTLYAGVVLWLVGDTARYAYYLGMAAMLNIFMIFTGMLGLLVKRTLNVSKSGIIVEDHESKPE